MKLLYSYLKKHKMLLFFALLMAAVNICFSLSDSVITGKLMQDCGVGISKYKGNEIGFTVENSTEKYTARVYATEPKIDLNTRNLTLRAVCTNSNGRLFAGSFAEIAITLAQNEQAFLIPSEAIVPQIKGKAVFLSKNGKAILQPIKTGTRLEKDVQVLEGLQIGDTIATSGVLQLRPNLPIAFVKITQ